MKDTNVTKVTSEFSLHGPEGEKYLASGIHLAMRLQENEQPNEKKPISKHPYETVGYVLKGKAELHLEEQTLILDPGDSWSVPKDVSHTYKIIERFTAVEATSRPPTPTRASFSKAVSFLGRDQQSRLQRRSGPLTSSKVPNDCA